MKIDLKKEIYQELKKVTKVSFNDQSLVSEIGIDSFILIEEVTKVEDKYGVRLSDEELQEIKTVGDIIAAFDKAMQSKK